MEKVSTRRPLLLGAAALASSIFPNSSVFAQEVLQNYRAFVDASNRHAYYYPSDWSSLLDLLQVISNLLRNIYSAPNQVSTIYGMQENVDGKNYYTFEYKLGSPTFTRTAFATIAIANDTALSLLEQTTDIGEELGSGCRFFQ
ncbi:PsbP, C-terminal, partial [Dillenia turbinata]